MSLTQRELRLHLIADGRHEAHHHLHLAGGEDGAECCPHLAPLVPLQPQHLRLPDLVRVRRPPTQVVPVERPVHEVVEVLDCKRLLILRWRVSTPDGVILINIEYSNKEGQLGPKTYY